MTLGDIVPLTSAPPPPPVQAHAASAESVAAAEIASSTGNGEVMVSMSVVNGNATAVHRLSVKSHAIETNGCGGENASFGATCERRVVVVIETTDAGPSGNRNDRDSFSELSLGGGSGNGAASRRNSRTGD